MPSGRWANSTRRSRLPTDWPRRRAHVLQRDGHRCTWHHAGHRCPHPATDVDHIKPGDDHRLANLQSLCADHHRQKTQAEAQAARRAKASRARRPPEPHPGIRGGG
jgi:5-methylcytosine-specific restriction endonuclease McrA